MASSGGGGARAPQAPPLGSGTVYYVHGFSSAPFAKNSKELGSH